MPDADYPIDGDFTLTVRNAVLIDLNTDAPRNTVIDVDEGFRIRIRWDVNGPGVPFLGGTWEVKAFVESMGQGFEGQVGSTQTVDVDGSTTYSTLITVPGGSLTPPPGGDDVVYRLVVLISHLGESGAKTIMAGFDDVGLFEVRTP